jgi:hypothetical protein
VVAVAEGDAVEEKVGGIVTNVEGDAVDEGNAEDVEDANADALAENTADVDGVAVGGSVQRAAPAAEKVSAAQGTQEMLPSGL